MKSASFLLAKTQNFIKTPPTENLHLSQVLNISTVVKCNIRKKRVSFYKQYQNLWKDLLQLAHNNVIGVIST